MASLRINDLLIDMLAPSATVPSDGEPVAEDTVLATGALVIEVMEGVRGPQGPAGTPGSSESVTLTQSAPSNSWVFVHGFGQFPIIEVYIGGVRHWPSIDYAVDTATITFPNATVGVAVARR